MAVERVEITYTPKPETVVTSRIVRATNTKLPKVSVDAKYSCGCGFKTTNMSEATVHSGTTGHRLTILGMVIPK